MNVGAFTCWLGARPLGQVLDFLGSVNIKTVEIGTGGYPGDAHAKPAELLADAGKLAQFRHDLASRGVTISALSCMGNPLHPNPEIAALHHGQFRDSVLLAEKLGVATVVTFAGCPGTPDGSLTPNWVTTTFPSEFADLLDWQWAEKVLPYWAEQVAFCAAHGMRVALELHPGFVVHNLATFQRLRDAVGPVIGAAFDPSHMFWQQMDPLEVVQHLGPAIFHVHAKDTVIHGANTRRNGIIDLGGGGRLQDRSWMFRTVGYGHDAQWWKSLVSALRQAGYDGTLSIEAEDSLMSPREGIEKAARLLHEAVMIEPANKDWQ